MQVNKTKSESGFSLVELLIATVVTLILLSIISTVFSQAMGVTVRENRKADALVSAQAALNLMSREIGNAGFGIYADATTQTPSNGIITADSHARQLRIRSNFDNIGDRSLPAGSTVLNTNMPGEDVTFFFDNATQSIVRFDPNVSASEPTTSVVVNRISDVTFSYFNYTSSSSSVTETAAPTSATSRVRITVVVKLDPVSGQPDNQSVAFTSDVTLRNASYMLRQY